MSSKPNPASLPLTDDMLDQLFSDCAALETLVASIRQAMAELNPAVDSGAVTAEHLMNLAFRIENAERGLITISPPDQRYCDQRDRPSKACGNGALAQRSIKKPLHIRNNTCSMSKRPHG